MITVEPEEMTDDIGSSQWTLQTLQDHLVMLINANDKRYDERDKSTKVAMDAALAAAKEAVIKAEGASEKRFDSVNEFRATLADQQRTLMPRAEVELLYKTLSDKIDALTEDAHTATGVKTGVRELAAYVIAATGVVMAVIFHFVH
jgi:hypothetical protein